MYMQDVTFQCSQIEKYVTATYYTNLRTLVSYFTVAQTHVVKYM